MASGYLCDMGITVMDGFITSELGYIISTISLLCWCHITFEQHDNNNWFNGPLSRTSCESSAGTRKILNSYLWLRFV